MPDDSTCVRIPLRRRDGTVVAHALVDVEDAALSDVRWSFRPDSYVTRRVPRGDGSRREITLYLHRVVAGLELGDGLEADHINGDRLDCRRRNLRVGSRATNGQNVPSRGGSSRYRGVYWCAALGKWGASAMLDGRSQHIGYFSTEEEAADSATKWRLAKMPFTNEGRRFKETDT